jgi:hypothetical protein
MSSSHTWQQELQAVRRELNRRDREYPFTTLLAFWEGYSAGYNAAQRGFMTPEQLVPIDFHRFVTEYYGRTFPAGGRGWQTFIREHSTTEQEAFDLFFQLRDEYEKRKPNAA